MEWDDFFGYEEYEGSADPKQEEARDYLKDFFEENKEEVFFSRQIEVQNEARFFHWITNRALNELRSEGVIVGEERRLSWGGMITLYWHKSYRYYKRKAMEVVNLVEEYSRPEISGSMGRHGELMVLDAFARFEFLQVGRETNKYSGRKWERTNHNLDFIFRKDGIEYGVEVKNTLGYMDYEEFKIKREICLFLNLRPIFVVRMMPKSWMKELIDDGGYGMILRFQLYPWTHRELARRVSSRFKLPVDAPRQIEDGTMIRFLKWHEKNV